MDPEKLATAKTVSEVISTTIGIIVTVGGGLYAYLKMRKTNADALVNASTMAADKKATVQHALKFWRYGAIGSVIILGCISITMIVFALLPGPDQSAMSRYLAKHDEKLFRHAPQGGLYDFARVIPDRQSLSTETDLAETLRETKHSFDLFAVHGISVLQNYDNELVAGLKRGVAFRVVLWGPDDTNKSQFDLMVAVVRAHSDSNMQRDRVRESIKRIQKLQQRVAADRATYKGSLDIRCLDKIGLFSMWIKDRNDPETAMGHITVYQYRGEAFTPSFRMTNKACKRTLDNLTAEFEEIWGSAKEPAATPP
jgi:hypothetical protein